VLIEIDDAVSGVLRGPAADAAPLRVKGDVDGEAVLTTDVATFSMRVAETSNAMLLTSLPSFEVKASLTLHYELAPRVVPDAVVAARVPVLGSGAAAVLSPPRPDQNAVTLHELYDAVPASPREIDHALKYGLAAFEHPETEVWVRLSEAAIEEIYDAVLDAVAAAAGDDPASSVGLAFSALDLDVITARFAGDYHPAALRAAVLRHVDVDDDARGDARSSVVALSGSRTATAKGAALANATRAAPLRLSEFLKRWRDETPARAAEPYCEPASLASYAVLVEPARRMRAGDDEPVVVALDARALPEDPARRFRALFAAKREWTLAELEPYMLPSWAKMRDKLLTRHARTFVDRATQERRFCKR